MPVSVCIVGYTMDTMYFGTLPDTVEIQDDLQMPQFKLINFKHIDCSQNYTSGFDVSIYIYTSHLELFSM